MKLFKFLWYLLCSPGYLTLFLKYLNPVEWSKTRNVAKTARQWRFRHILAPFITAFYAFLLFSLFMAESNSSELSENEEPAPSSSPLINNDEKRASSSSSSFSLPPSANAAENTIPAAFHGVHSDGAYSYKISAASIVNYDGGKYMVKKVVAVDEGRICVVTVTSTTGQDVITLRHTSRGKTKVTSRKLDDEWERYKKEGGDAPD
ncbi:hypothetical protein N9733_07300 [Akkermansiaceae bacterium]|nr:hypothetical protein [Akkermansiaceae bacterium]